MFQKMMMAASRFIPCDAVMLAFAAPVADFAAAVEADGALEGMMRLALVQADLHAALEAGVHDPVDHEERAPDAADFAQTRRAFVLAQIGGELFQDVDLH